MPHNPGGDSLRPIGHHPRGPARSAQVEPADRLLGNVPGEEDGRRHEVGRDGEERALRAAERRQAEAAERRQADGGDYVDRPLGPGATSSSDPAGSASQANRSGPDQDTRTRRHRVETGVGPEGAPDWPFFDTVRIVRALKLCAPAQTRLSLRKLHLRWCMLRLPLWITY